MVDPAHASSLGVPLGDESSVSIAIEEKIPALVRMGERFKLLSAHDSLLLLQNSFSLPKLLYLRTAPHFKSPTLKGHEDALHLIVCSIVNTHLGDDDPAWLLYR